jgi:hypothetical protein
MSSVNVVVAKRFGERWGRYYDQVKAIKFSADALVAQTSPAMPDFVRSREVDGLEPVECFDYCFAPFRDDYTIKGFLVEQKLKPGEMIPGESVLAESLKVGRGSVREALKLLSACGVIGIRKGTGTLNSSASNRRLCNPSLFQ